MEKHGNVFLKFYQNDPEIPKYGVETFDHLGKRVLDMIEYVRNKHPGESVVLVTHMDPIKAAVSARCRFMRPLYWTRVNVCDFMPFEKFGSILCLFYALCRKWNARRASREHSFCIIFCLTVP